MPLRRKTSAIADPHNTASLRARKAWRTRRMTSAFVKSRASEAASKEALRLYCEQHGWRLALFEGATGSPHTGIVDAVIFRLARSNADVLELQLVQLKGGNAGVTASEISRFEGRRAERNRVVVDRCIRRRGVAVGTRPGVDL
jgi:hypothetical protein